MTKKELEEKLKNIPKDKYIYQRHDGIIHKYIDKGNYYINCETGNAYEKYDNIFLGKISDNLMDLIEEGDFVNGYKVSLIDIDNFDEEGTDKKYLLCGGTAIFEEEIETILTKEIFEANCYKVKEE